ncbi:MAG: RES domain-containing protein [Azonexus sp.]|jgi:RES domain-containing protein|nr:RES domain-containing protein [Azonexus sp.]
MRLFRIGDTRHPLWSGQGAAIFGDRWNSPGLPVIYCARTQAGAMLEVLVHANIGHVPKHHGLVIVDLPADSRIERRPAETLPQGWDGDDLTIPRAFGDQWIREQRSLILMVPSVVSKLDFNAVVNCSHPDFSSLKPSAIQSVAWDRRLWEQRAN